MYNVLWEKETKKGVLKFLIKLLGTLSVRKGRQWVSRESTSHGGRSEPGHLMGVACSGWGRQHEEAKERNTVMC